MTADSPNRMTSLRQLRKGLAIYKTARSPYWMVRQRDPAEGRYIVRSTKEESRIEAISAANEFADSFFKRANSDQARKTTTSFEYYATQMLGMQKPSAKTHDSDRKLLYRQKDGIVRHFGDYDVTKITTKMIREYLLQLDKTRGKPLADSTRAKHVIVIRKVLALAVEDGLMKTIPVMPKQKTTDTPRHTFTDDEYKKFMKAAADCVSRGDEVRGVRIAATITQADYNEGALIVHPQYVGLSATMQGHLRGLYQVCCPRPLSNLLVGGERPIVAGELEFRCTSEELFFGLVEVIYALRNSLLHGELQPDERAFRTYEPAYRIVMRFLNCVR